MLNACLSVMPLSVMPSGLLRMGAAVLLAGSGLTVAGCGAPSDSPSAESITDQAYLTADRWNDGQAEVAFYRVEREYNQYGEPEGQSFLVGTYLVKHNFNVGEMTKATEGGGEPAFKYALFYELESGSYQYKRNYVTNARQRDLRPFKHSFTSFDWCSNQYRELAFHMTGTVDHLKRSDDYGNEASRYAYQPSAVPAAQVPLLVRGLDFAEADQQGFMVIRPDGEFVRVEADYLGPDTLQHADTPTPAERIRLTYSERAPSPIAETVDSTETYWRGAGEARLLLRVESGSGSYQMTLVEHLRTPYWEENIWPKLERIEARP